MIRLDVVKQLEDLAEWFENPRVSPMIFIRLNGTQYAVDTILRQIAQNLEAEGWSHGTLCDMRGSPAQEPGQHGHALPGARGVGNGPDLPKGAKSSRGARGEER